MAAIGILDLLRRNPNFGCQSFSSRGLFAAKLIGTSASVGASFAFTAPFAFGSLFRNGGMQIAYCDLGVPDVEETLGTDYFADIRAASQSIFQNDALKYSTKQYDIELKPLFSALHWKTLSITSIRTFLLFYLPLLEPFSPPEDEEDDFLLEDTGEQHVDLVTPFHKSVKQIIRETSVATTRRVLERLAVHYASQRMAWKLLKDVPKSAMRKAGRRMPASTFIFCVGRSTCRGHFLGVLASWIVQIGIDVYRFVKSLWSSGEEVDGTSNVSAEIRLLVERAYSDTVKCASSLVFASIGAGIGAILIRPSTGQWIGCAIGDMAGPMIVTLLFQQLHLEL